MAAVKKTCDKIFCSAERKARVMKQAPMEYKETDARIITRILSPTYGISLNGPTIDFTTVEIRDCHGSGAKILGAAPAPEPKVGARLVSVQKSKIFMILLNQIA
ncbi:unnamed protein product [Bursaphelenchus xylophilus]|uniref:(pine wood nematode) hypothetical protein n=1 Tax=Bursaphelenchus xylophilus TaxID=6326 RepID=A0A1I7S0N5_BURXY|nr:unnamed protein product [Bursaphelenchus xylophilus]CAG9088507.1 unnamed protein product [Bursaphelenchus xylophilus]